MNATPFLNFLDESKSDTRTLPIGAKFFFTTIYHYDLTFVKFSLKTFNYWV